MQRDDYVLAGAVCACLLLGTWFTAVMHVLMALTWGRIRKLNPQTEQPLIAAAERWMAERDAYRILVRFLALLNLAVVAVLFFHLADVLLQFRGTEGTLFLTTFACALGGTVVFLAVTEVVGNGLLVTRPWPVLRLSIPGLRPLYFLFYPLVHASLALQRRLGAWQEEEAEEQRSTTADEIMSLVEQDARQRGRGEALPPSARRMIQGIFDLDQSLVKEIMTPRVDLCTLPLTATVAAARQQITDCGHSRIPIYRTSVDDIVGVIHAKDLLADPVTPEAPLEPLVHQAMFIPETKNVRELLDEFRQSNHQLAVVLDEYGGTAGLVTVEDILEEIVGEIRDEFEAPQTEPVVKIEPDGSLVIEARTPVDEVNELLGVHLPDDEQYDTVGGYVSCELGRIPQRGEELTVGELHVTVLEADPRHLIRVRLRACTGGARPSPMPGT